MPTKVPPAPAPVSVVELTARMVYAELRALQVVHEFGWAEYIAGDLPDRRHIMRLPSGYRELIRPAEPTGSESYWWARGLADAYGEGDAVGAILAEPLPDLVSVQDAASLLPAADRWGQRKAPRMTPDGITHNITRGVLYPLYGHGRSRHLFRLQIEWLAADRRATDARLKADTAQRGRAAAEEKAETAELRAAEAKDAWLQVRGLLPPDLRIHSLSFDATPAPSPDPLPIPPGRAETSRRSEALATGHDLGWFEFVHPPLDSSGMYGVSLTNRGRGSKRVTREVVNGVDLQLPGDAVLPWVLGQADYRGESALVAYRPGLG